MKRVLMAISLVAAACSNSEAPAGGGGAVALVLGTQEQVSEGLGAAGGMQICCEGQTVYVVWEDDRNDPGGFTEIFFNRSLDGGVTWLAQDVRVDRDEVCGLSYRPRICCSGQNVYVAYMGERNGRQDIFFNYSTDGGESWQVFDTQLDSGSADSTDHEIACDGLNVCVVWGERLDGNGSIAVNYSIDGGASWQNEHTLISEPHSGIGGDNASFDPKICMSGQRVYVAWIDNRNGQAGVDDNDIYFDYSVDGGATWKAVDQRLDTDDPANADSRLGDICCDGLSVYVAWVDHRHGDGDIYFNSSLDGGATFQQSDVRLSDPATTIEAGEAALCCEGRNVYLVFKDKRFGEDDLYFNASSDGGVTWLPRDRPIESDVPGAADSENAKICCANGHVFVVWNDTRADPGGDDIYLNYSPDGGATWLAEDMRLDADPPGTVDAGRPQICCGAGGVYVVWDTTPRGDVHFNRVGP